MNNKTIIACPGCDGKMRVPVSPTALKVKCPFCGNTFRHEPDPYFSGTSRGFNPNRSAQNIKTGFKNAVSSFAAWSPGRKLFLYISILALVITVLSQRSETVRVYGGADAVGAEQYVEKPYLLEDPEFIALLKQKALEKARRR
jgi:hypothetical protein